VQKKTKRKGNKARLHATHNTYAKQVLFHLQQLGQSPNRNYAMSRKMGVEMGMEKEGSILTTALLILKFL
jgi:hypothetical protein